MKINETDVEFSIEERNIIKKFFDENSEFIWNTDLNDYENIKIFGNMYQTFLEDNNLIENDKLLLFLLEIRYNQLSHKLTKDSLNLKIRKLSKSKWYLESKILMYHAEMNPENKKALQLQLDQNARKRSASFKEASKKIVK